MRYQFNGFKIDTSVFTLFLGDKPIAIEPKSFDLLVFLLINRHKIVTRDEILDSVWRGTIVSDATLSNHIKDVRKILGDKW